MQDNYLVSGFCVINFILRGEYMIIEIQELIDEVKEFDKTLIEIRESL